MSALPHKPSRENFSADQASRISSASNGNQNGFVSFSGVVQERLQEVFRKGYMGS